MSPKSIDKEGKKDAGNNHFNPLTIPADIKEILSELAEVRRIVLMDSPALLPKLAPALSNAESILQDFW
jgi:hypothetical protein